MSRETHVRFWGSARVRLPRATRLPVYRQHQRLADAGITLSRSTLTHYIQRTIALLRHIYEAEWRHVLQSKALAMDETPIKAGNSVAMLTTLPMATFMVFPVGSGRSGRVIR